MNSVVFVPLFRPTAVDGPQTAEYGAWQSALQGNSSGPLGRNDAGVDVFTDIVDAPPNESS